MNVLILFKIVKNMINMEIVNNVLNNMKLLRINVKKLIKIVIIMIMKVKNV